MAFTLIIVIITVLVSIAAFNSHDLMNKLILWPRYMDNPSEYYRLLTSGFIHADWNHLIFNMISLYCFGGYVESFGSMTFAVLYLLGIVFASLPSFVKNRNNSYYRSLGASGGVSAVVFFVIYFSPWSRIMIFFIPIGIPSIVYGVLFLAYEAYMSKRGSDNINHDAHFWGSLFGVLVALTVDPTHGLNFLNEIIHPR